jgi:hypothetical protein
MDTVLAMLCYLKTCIRAAPKRPPRTPALAGTDEPPGPDPGAMLQTRRSGEEWPHGGMVEASSALETRGFRARGCRGGRAWESSLLEGRHPGDSRAADSS